MGFAGNGDMYSSGNASIATLLERDVATVVYPDPVFSGRLRLKFQLVECLVRYDLILGAAIAMQLNRTNVVPEVRHCADKGITTGKRRFIMPGRDGTGPMGAGAKTGGGFGNCTGQGAARQSVGRRGGQGGGGNGSRRMFQTMRGTGRFGFNGPSRDSGLFVENQELMRQNEAMRLELDTIMKRLDAMEVRTAKSQ